ncbi:MAG: O-antigen ligase family protein [Phycisphaerales bacterium]|nr:O-antigen ligase family protein [Phycisphaerales bacterium]
MSPPSLDHASIRLRVIERLLGVLVAAIIGLALLKATTPAVAFPGWDLDPSLLAGPVIGVGPTATLGIDVSILTLSAAVLALSAAIGAAVSWWRWLLLLAGAAAFAWHARFSPDAAHEHLTIGASWIAAIAAGLAISAAARLESIARLVSATLLASIAFLVLKAGVQVFIENPQTIEMFKANREAMLAAQGWAPDSFAAKAFERRLYDAPGTGWLGLSNVLATAGACAAVSSLTLLACTARIARPPLGTLLAALSGVAVLYFAGSKGGWAAAALGVVLVVAWPWLARRQRWTPLVLISLPVLALAAVALRGVVGERIGELSLLFRAQYLAAASRIFAEHPLTGVGPAGFKDAYLLAKSPLNPEEITSPHSVFFDFAATLGIGGLAWAALLLSQLAAAGRAAHAGSAHQQPADQPADSSETDARSSIRLALLTLAVVTIAGSWIELEISSPANVLVRIGGLALASWIAWAVLQTRDIAHLRIAAAIAAAVALTHGMIELTPVQSGSSGLFFCLLGLASATRPLAPARSALKRALPGLAACAIGAAMTLWIFPVSRWEALLRSGASSIGQPAMIGRAWSEANDSVQRAAALQRLSDAAGRSVAPDEASITEAMNQLRRAGAAAALQDLIAAIAVIPSDAPTREAASRVALQLAALHPPASEQRRDLRQTAIQIEADATRLPLKKAASLAWLANVLRGAADLGGDPTLRRDALDALERAAALDPNNPLHASNAARLAAELRDQPKASQWARKALDLNANMRLDPLRQFDERERRTLESLARSQ